MTAKTQRQPQIPPTTEAMFPWLIVRKLSDDRELPIARCLSEPIARRCAYYLSTLQPGEKIEHRRGDGDSVRVSN